MSAPHRPAAALTAALVAERFPTYREARREAVRAPGLVRRPGPAPAALVDDDISCARRRRDLCEALAGGPARDLPRIA